jgi:hypothetical protein
MSRFVLSADQSFLRGIFQHSLSHTENIQLSSLPSPIEEVSKMIGQVSQERMNTDFRRLTGAEEICLDNGCYTITDRITESTGLQWAKDYVIAQLKDLGYSVEIQDWSLSGYDDQNLIVKKVGITQPEEEIYFVAHLDGIAGGPAADDNGSGVVDLLELARNLRHHVFAKTIVLLISTGEEEGAQGVQYYVDHLTSEQLAAIKYVIDVDMVGYDSNGDSRMELWNGEQPLDFVQYLMDIITAYQINLVPEVYSDCS